MRNHTTTQQELGLVEGRKSAHAVPPAPLLLLPVLPAVDGFNVAALKPGTATELLLSDSAGQQQRTFADKEGWFTLFDVPPGSYVLTTYNPMFVYPEVWLNRPSTQTPAQYTGWGSGASGSLSISCCTPGMGGCATDSCWKRTTSSGRGALPQLAVACALCPAGVSGCHSKVWPGTGILCLQQAAGGGCAQGAAQCTRNAGMPAANSSCSNRLLRANLVRACTRKGQALPHGLLSVCPQVMVKPFVIRPAVQAQYYEVGGCVCVCCCSQTVSQTPDTQSTCMGCCSRLVALPYSHARLHECCCCGGCRVCVRYPRCLPATSRNVSCPCAPAVAAHSHTSLPCVAVPVGVSAACPQMRKPLDLWSMIKSPYGLMFGFMLFGIFVFPMLKVDPEEYEEAMAALRGGQQAQSQQQRIRDR